MANRVFIRGGKVYLDSDMYGPRQRLSTGKDADKRTLNWYNNHFEMEFKALYEHKTKSKVHSGNLSFRDYGHEIIGLTSTNRNQHSQKEAEGMFNRLCEFFGDMELDAIKASTILHWQNEWQNERGFASKTIHDYRGIINQVLKMAIHDDLISKNPLEAVTPPKKKAVKKKVFYYEEDFKKLIDAADGQIKNAIQLTLFTGVRGSELIALRWGDDIMFDDEMIIVDTRIRDGVEDHTKSDQVRYIPMFKQANEALRRQERLTALRGDFVFVTQYGKPYNTPKTLTVTFQKVCKKAGVEVGGLHDLRRSFNTLLKQTGYQNDWINKIMGHMDDDVNVRHYTGNIKIDKTLLERVVV